jgi:predicted metal-dependent peptidase
MSVDLTTKLAKAKTALILEHPFIGTLAMKMPFELSEDVPTAGTNGKRVKFNPHFIENLTDEELKFLVAHEICHPMFEHPWRRHDRDHQRWNIAGDYVINELLVADGIGKMPEGGLQDTSMYDAGGGTTDGIFKLLPEQEEGDGDSGTGSGGEGWQDCEDGEGTQADKDQAAAEMKVSVAQAAQAAKMMGKMSSGMARLVDEVLNPKVDWREVLRRFVEKCRSDTRTFARPNRRYMSQGLYLPSVSGEAMGELAFAIDCSGSVGADDLNQFTAELLAVHEDHKPRKIHLIYFDNEVSHYESFSKDDELHVEPHGGGGTDFAPVFRYMEEHDIEPVATVFLTDLYCNSFGKQPDHPVLWVSNGEKEAPFGEVVMM